MKDRTVSRLVRRVLRHKGWLALALLASLFSNLLAIAGPFVIGLGIDHIIEAGAVEFDIMGEVFTAENDCLVHIPPYHRHKIRVLEDSEIFDYGGEMNLMALLEDYRSLEKYQPEKLKDPEFMTAFQRKYECYVTKFYRES